MKFFVPELYLRYISQQENISKIARDEWKSTTISYKRHLQENSKYLNEKIRDFVENICLHHAELLSIQENAPSRSAHASFLPISVAVISLRSDLQMTNLIYFLWSEIRQSRPNLVWPDSNDRTRWLYDEFDVEKHPSYLPMYWHRILWSNGSVCNIPFSDLIVQTFSLS
jgi:hypothetical protein